MEFDFGTIIYVILAIVYFIIQSNSKNKQKRQQAEAQDSEPSESEPTDRRPSFEELLAEFTGQKQAEPEVVLQPAPKLEEVVSEKSTYQIAQERIDKRRKEAEVESAKIKARTNEISLFKAPEEEFEEDRVDYSDLFGDLDSAKKAFIASEVFQRKYN